MKVQDAYEHMLMISKISTQATQALEAVLQHSKALEHQLAEAQAKIKELTDGANQ